MPEPPKPGRSSSRVVLGIAVVLVIVAAIVGGYFVLAGDDETAGGDDTTTTTSSGGPDIPTPGNGSDDPDDSTSTSGPDDPDDPPVVNEDDLEADANGNTAVDTVYVFYDAFESGDCETMVDTLTDDALTEDDADYTREQAVSDCEEAVDLGIEVTLDDVSVVDPGSGSGDDVILSITSSADGESVTEDWIMVLDPDVWKFDGQA